MILVRAVSIILSILLATSVFASNYKCTTWTKRRKITCLFAGRTANAYQRQCENYCWRSPRSRNDNWGPDCDQERVCYTKNPTSFDGGCSQWVKVRSVSCHNPASGDWEQRWDRACTVGLRERICSDQNPNKF